MEKKITALYREFTEGCCEKSYMFLGVHKCEQGYVFRVWAPRAKTVRLCGDFNFWNTEELFMKKNEYGIWEVISVFAKKGDKYKYYIEHYDGNFVYKSDPYARRFADLPDTSGIVWEDSEYRWRDEEFRNKNNSVDHIDEPMNIYEVHFGSFLQNSDGSLKNYREIADELVPYVKKMGYTHIEVMPICEHPYYPSWGYQVTGYFAPTHRYGTPDDFKYFVNKAHRFGIGVILDWVGAHFPKDECGLFEFDGTAQYELDDPQMNEHPEWNTRIFDYEKPQVKSFLTSSCCYWIKEYHIDGIRVDAVASMLYLDYARKSYKPNRYGGNQNLAAIDFLRVLNQKAFAVYGGVLMIAEESTAYPMVTKPPHDGGLGFNFKWNMGWMNDILGYMKTDPLFRKGRHYEMTFSFTYAFSENFILPLSHDEVVHGKCSILNKMPGEYEDKFANLRLLYAFMFAHPGKKLNFMGGEFGQFIEWDFKKPLDWFLLEYDSHRQTKEYVKDLNRFYLKEKALWNNERDYSGFCWISADDCSQSVIAFKRTDREGNDIVCVFNFCPVKRENYRLGLPKQGLYKPVFSSASRKYGGTEKYLKSVKTEPIPMHCCEQSGVFSIPPLGAVFYKLSKNNSRL